MEDSPLLICVCSEKTMNNVF
uniref:Uncharacterized protein n=1 Tax=Nelumbo nucifera TaxID=4432 RepID=A0A822XLK8_NELNU|nr:TPA_asm: hypothetical protein HUJ06_023967 [Nelumbo nucifera]